ncbi:MAG: AAA family ATPase [Candidatus Omnitrophica bacterium]|nr:AAA family ATPase [Candidatus Omnitrophota bacterium]
MAKCCPPPQNNSFETFDNNKKYKNDPFKKFLIFLKLNAAWIIFWIVIILVAIASVLFINYCFTNFGQMEGYYKKSMSAQMALMLPMFALVQLITLPMYLLMNYWLMQGGGIGTLKKGSVNPKDMEVKWADVIGMEDAKKDAWEVVELLRNQKLLQQVGGKIIKGTLLIGPPGCGKTYLAKAIATECEMPLISTVGSEFVCMFVGQGAAKMRSLFKKARKLAKLHGGCIIFIDEIDSFARPRTGESGFGASSSMNATVNQFLTELDGLNAKENNIVIIAATNVEEEELEPAIMRSGRFDRKIRVEKPTSKEREALITYYLGKVQSDAGIDIPALADHCKWFSPSDISNMVREAGIIALRDKRLNISKPDLDEAVKRIMTSIEKMGGDKILSQKVNVKWDEVIGMKEIKEEAWEIVELLRDRQKLQKIGGKIVKGILFFGPPGCGKTYIGKAMATECGYPFIYKSGSEIGGIFIGLGAKAIKHLFDEARRLARAEGGCIIFIDEIDTIARHRVSEFGFGGGQDHNQTINQLLTEMDGLRQNENNIILMGATNAQEFELDSALMRAGRFERKIYVTLPNLKDREELFKFYLAKVSTEPDVKPDILSRRTLWFSPADIDNMIREAGLIALRDKREVISYKDLSKAYDRILYGAKSNTNLSPQEKEWVAYHESGHAIIGYILNPTDDVIKATIIPHKGALGFVAPRAREEYHIQTREWFIARIKTCVASYAAEMIKFGSTGSGVGGGPGSDFFTAMELAKSMVWNYGMGPSGLVGDFTAMESLRYKINDNAFLSEKTRERLNDDVQSILQNCIKDVTDMLNQNRGLLDHFAQQLVEKGELEYDEIETIFNQFNVKPLTRKSLNN